jgi:hypothetical protein
LSSLRRHHFCRPVSIHRFYSMLLGRKALFAAVIISGLL